MVNVIVTKARASFGFVLSYLSRILNMLVHGARVIFSVKFGKRGRYGGSAILPGNCTQYRNLS